MIVIDASVAVAWFFHDEVDDFAQQAATRIISESAIVPPIFPLEVLNALLVAHRRQRISERSVRNALRDLDELPIRIDSPSFGLETEIGLAQRHKLTIYDASYLALARRYSAELLTCDVALRRAALAELPRR